MSQVLSGNFALAKVIHPLDSKDGTQIGPTSWTLVGGAQIQSDSKFGNAIQANASGEWIEADGTGFLDFTDTAKTMVHAFRKVASFGGSNRTTLDFPEAGGALQKVNFRVFATSLELVWVRETIITPGKFAIFTTGSAITVPTGTFFTVGYYVNAASLSEGKLFFNGTDVTGSVTDFPSSSRAANKKIIIGNCPEVPSQFGDIVDHLTIIQGSFLSNTKAKALNDQGSDTRGLGFRPSYAVQSPDPALGGEVISLFGSGFAKDVTVKIGGQSVRTLSRVSESQINIIMPNIGIQAGFETLEITNVEAGVTLTVTDEFVVGAADDEELVLILRGVRGPGHPVCKLEVVDDNGNDLTISGEVKKKQIVLRRDDRRTTLGRFVPPIQSLDITFKNDKKQFTNTFGGEFDGLLIQGRIVKPFLGFKVKGIDDFKQFGKFVVDDVEFPNSPPASAVIKCRDLLSAALDQEISLRSFASIRGDLLIGEILSRVGIVTAGANSEILFLQTTTVFTSTTVIKKTRALDILSEVMGALQAEANYRLLQDTDGIIKLVVVPFTGLADQAFHYKTDVSKPYTQKERANQSSKRTTVTKVNDPTVTEDVQLFSGSFTEADFTGSPPQKVIALSKAIRINWEAPGGLTQDFEVKEVARTPTSLTLEMINPVDTGTINILVRGDTTSAVVGEAGSGEDQGGAGLGNNLDRQKLRRGEGRDVLIRFLNDNTAAQAAADVIQQRFGDPASEQDFKNPLAAVRTKLNDMIRVIEKFSESRNLHSVSTLIFTYSAGSGEPGSGDSLTSKIIALDAGIVEPAVTYDSGFKYDIGLIYDGRFKVGAKEDEDRTFRGAPVRDL